MCYFKNSPNLKYYIIFFVMGLMIFPFNAIAQTTLIRDAEIENTLKEWGVPIFKSAGLTPSSVNIVLVENSNINAFVAGGSNIFFYTGLLTKTENPEEVIGVLAHETGHITGGHLIKTRDALERASYESIIGTILGLGAAIATGESSAVPAIVGGGQAYAQRSFLSHSRINESSADQAALNFMDQSGLNPTGMATFFKKLEADNYVPENRQSEYVRTHPLTSNRIEAVEHHIKNSSNKDKKLPSKWYEQHARMKAKIIGFVNPTQVPWIYDDNDKSVSAQYARAIAAYRTNNVDIALKGIDNLLTQEPNNPYFLELKGQILVDFGRVKQAIPYYRKSIETLPDAGLFRIALAHALIAMQSAGNKEWEEAVSLLNRALKTESRTPSIHRLLATAYGKLGQQDMAKLHLAEEAVLQRNYDYAQNHAQNILNNAEKGSSIAIKAKDILTFIENVKKG